jgi:heat shock protein 1/8
MKHWPFKV